MSKRCEICQKRELTGNSIRRRGKAKKEGGVGKKITSTTRRIFKPNLQRITARIDGKPEKIWICTRCLKKNKVTKA